MSNTTNKEENLLNEPGENEDLVHIEDEAETPAAESPEKNPAEQNQMQSLRQEIENMPVDETVKMQARTQAQTMQPLDDDKKVRDLIALAQTKGVIYAVHVAKNMNNPFILDALHDALAKEGLYKKFSK